MVGRGCFIILAALALVVQALLPEGVMAGGRGDAPGLVICTGHGPLILDPHQGGPAKPAKSSHDTVCAFAGHGVGVWNAPPPFVLNAAFAYYATGFAGSRDLVPGRGLAAPPPPSQGPPDRLI